jgi:glucan phosphoethanolaminetransferase (alkaline phosphatase superfamily)
MNKSDKPIFRKIRSPKPLTDETIRRIGFAYVLFLFAFECYVVKVDYSNYFVYVFEEESIFFFALTIVCLIVSFWLLFRVFVIALSSSWHIKVICFLLFAWSFVVEYGYQKGLGRFSQQSDLEIALATTTEQKLSALSMYLSYAAVIPCIVLLGVLVFVRNKQRLGSKEFAFANALLIISFTAFSLTLPEKSPTLATNAFYRTNVEFLIYGPLATGKWGSELTGLSAHRRPIPKPRLPENYRPGNNVIVVIDESVRGDHLSLNGYGRKTTPFLDELSRKGVLHNWGIAASACTNSRFSYSAIITGLTPDDFPDTSGSKANYLPTIFQYAKSMSYTTYFFDGQMKTYWGGIEDDQKYFDNWSGVLEIGDGLPFESWKSDNLIAKKVNRIISSSTGNFIFVFKHGSHYPYQNNFPPSQEIWTPSYTTEHEFDIPSGSQLREVVNAYDNSLRYNIDSFFENLIDDYSNIPNNSVIVYTGDHGQTLFTNGKASHSGQTKEEANVPLFIIGQLDPNVDTSYKASHFNLYPTILDLIDYPLDLRGKSSALSLLKAKSTDSRPRFFNPAYGNKVPFD